MKKLLTLTAALLLLLPSTVLGHSSGTPPGGHPFIHGEDNSFFQKPTPDQYHWADWLGGWVDARCGTSDERFVITFFENADYGGKRTRVCHAATNRTGSGTNADWCEVPMGDNGSWEAVDGCRKVGSKWGVANDKVSSMIINRMPAGKCIRLFENSNHDGGWWTFDQNVPDFSVFHVGGYWWSNDTFSSIKRKDGGACDNLPTGHA